MVQSNYLLLATSLLSGIVCYRLGIFAGCASNWMTNIQEVHSSTIDSISNLYDHDDPEFYNNNDMRSKTKVEVSMTATADSVALAYKPKYEPGDRRSVLRPSVPYKCGTYVIMIIVSNFLSSFYSTSHLS